MSRKNMYQVRGTVHWAKILGNPVPDYNGDKREWTMDFTPDEESMKTFEDLGLSGRIKDKNDDRGKFFQFRQREKRQDGSLNKRISVSDSRGNPWPEDKLIGNGSAADVKFEFKDYGAGKFPGVYPKAVRVLDHHEYVPKFFDALENDDPFYEPIPDFSRDFDKDFGLEDLPPGKIEATEEDDDFPE